MEVYVYDKTRKKVLGKKSVPVILAPKEKVVSVLSVIDGAPKPEIDNHLPKISIIWQGLSWDSARQTGSNHRRELSVEYSSGEGNKSVKVSDRQTVPYILEFQVTLWTAYLDESVQLLENILPFFHPDMPISLYERATGQERKCKTELVSVTPNFVYELNEPDRRIIQFDLNFTMECNLYRPLEINGVIEKALIGISAVTSKNSTFNEGDVIYTTTSGISGSITDDQIRQTIIAFDEIDSDYTNFEIEEEISKLDIMKLEAINNLPAGTDDETIKILGDEYDVIIRSLGYSIKSMPFNALQFRRGLIDTLDYARIAFIENSGILDVSFPKFYEDGYQEQYDQLTDNEKNYVREIHSKFENQMYVIIKANELNEYIQSLVENNDTLFNLDESIAERTARYNRLLD